MNKGEAVLRYKASMSIFKKWAVDGLISADDLLAIDTKIAEKYGVSLSSIYRENELLCIENRANIP